MSDTDELPAARIDLATARSRVSAAMALAHISMRAASTRGHVAGWLQREDGAWSAVDNLGRIRPPFAYGPYCDDEHQGDDEPHSDVFADADAALAAINEHDVIDVDPLYSPALQQLLQVAERIARDSGASTVDVDHLELAMRHQAEARYHPLGG
ncbi:hypothetical protein AB0H58_31350 [Nocardia neocaledoniensis]|uniref:hypothetical protein n=1 Tax=Nocardia neocaledoniensis TaxID=236511 RepID=UPI0033C2AEC5